MKFLTKLVFALIVIGLGAVGFAFSGIYDVSATNRHGALVHWLLSTTSRHSIQRRAGHILVPDLNDDALKLAGVDDYNSMCIGCHGAPGVQAEAVGKGLYPPAPDLSESASHMMPAELFWVVQNGIKNTGMPAWGATHDDAELWPVVAFLVILPELDAQAYQSMLAQAAGKGHHASDASNPHAAHSHAATVTPHTHHHGQSMEGSSAPTSDELEPHEHDSEDSNQTAEPANQEIHDDHHPG